MNQIRDTVSLEQFKEDFVNSAMESINAVPPKKREKKDL